MAQIADTCGFLRAEGVRTRAVCAALNCRNYTHSHYLQISRGLTLDLKAVLHRGGLTLGQARAIARVPPGEQHALADKAVRGRISVRSLEAVARGFDARLNAEDEAYYDRLSTHIGDAIGHPVIIKPDRGDKRAGTISVRYENLDMFEAICARMRVSLEEF